MADKFELQTRLMFRLYVIEEVKDRNLHLHPPLEVENCYFLRLLHCRTLGQIKHSSVHSDGALSSPLKCAHFAGESKTIGYSVALIPTIFSFTVSRSRRDMQKGQA